MYSFFDQAGKRTQRTLAVAGSLIITMVVMATAFLPASPSTPFIIGALA